METVTDFIFLGVKITMDSDCSHEIKRYLLLGRKAVTNLVNILILLLLLFCFTILYWFCHTSEHIKKQRHHFADKGWYSQSCGFSSSRIWMWKLDHKEGWALKNWCFWTVVLEKTLESPLDSKEIKPVNPKGNQPWIFIGKTDAQAEAPIFWPPNAKCWLTEIYLVLGKIEGKRKGSSGGWDS